MEVGSPKQKDLMRKRTESLDSIEREIETMQTKTEPEPVEKLEETPVSRGLGKKNCFKVVLTHGLRMPSEALFSSKSQIFGLGLTIWAYMNFGALGYFQKIYQHPF